jgi:hypothetical protein
MNVGQGREALKQARESGDEDAVLRWTGWVEDNAEALLMVAEAAETLIDEIHNRVTSGVYDDEAGLSEVRNSVEYMNLETWLKDTNTGVAGK